MKALRGKQVLVTGAAPMAIARIVARVGCVVVAGTWAFRPRTNFRFIGGGRRRLQSADGADAGVRW